MSTGVVRWIFFGFPEVMGISEYGAKGQGAKGGCSKGVDEVFSFHPSKIGNSALIGFNVLQTKLQSGSAVVCILFDAVAGMKNLTVGDGGPVFC